MPTNRKVIDFKIHNLTEEQFQELKKAGQIDPNAIYCTPDETVANFEAVNARIDETNKKLNTFESGVNETVGVINTTIVNVDKKVDEAIQTEQQHNIEINARVDETDDKLDKKVSIVQGEENAGKVLVVNEYGEVVPDKPKVGASLPILTHVFSDHTLNDMSWLNADTFSWQSGDVYKAVYEHLVSEMHTENLYAWEEEEGRNRYTRSATPSVGDPVYTAAGSQISTVESVGTDYIVFNGTTCPRNSGGDILGTNAETDTVDDITITFYRAEDGHKICLADQETNVQRLYDATGIAWYYILDAENKQFKLPRTKFGFTGLRDEVGKYVPAGLPNITGEAGYYLANVGSLGVSIATGAFAKTGSEKPPTATKTGTESTAVNTRFDFNASRSSSVYGNSNTVQPPATQMYLYFYVGNFEKEAVEQVAGLNAEMFNNKADSDLKNTPLQVDSTGKILVSGTILAQSTNNRELRLQVGDDVNNGSLLALYGQESTQGTAGFLLRACLEEGKYNDLVGRTDGNLSWKGERISCIKSEQLPTVDNGYAWYKVYDDGFVIQGGRCIGTWEIEAGQEQVPYVTMAIPMNTTHIYPFFTCKELYCFPMGWYIANSTTLRPRFGSYTVKRTLTQFDWVVFGRKA